MGMPRRKAMRGTCPECGYRVPLVIRSFSCPVMGRHKLHSGKESKHCQGEGKEPKENSVEGPAHA
jgi:hypothetical protein